MSRADRVTARLAGRELDALLVTDLVNVRYLTGFTGSNGLVLLRPDRRFLATDSRYVEQAGSEVVDGFEVEPVERELREALAGGWPERPLRLGFEDRDLSVHSHARLRATLPERVELIPASGLVEAERAVKETGEVAAIRAAAALVDEIYAWLLEQGLVGRTERAVALALEQELRMRGAEGPSFPSIVAAGANGALPHATPREVAIPRDTLVTIDIGARLAGYCSDCTRTWATGTPPDELTAIHATVLAAQQAALDAVRPGPAGRELDAIARGLIEAAGHAEHFGHGLGHGVGMEVHEAPRLTRTAEARLVAGNVVTVEPGIYLPGRGGVRIEDLVLVTESGHELLSATPKRLLTVG